MIFYSNLFSLSKNEALDFYFVYFYIATFLFTIFFLSRKINKNKECTIHRFCNYATAPYRPIFTHQRHHTHLPIRCHLASLSSCFFQRTQGDVKSVTCLLKALRPDLAAISALIWLIRVPSGSWLPPNLYCLMSTWLFHNAWLRFVIEQRLSRWGRGHRWVKGTLNRSRGFFSPIFPFSMWSNILPVFGRNADDHLSALVANSSNEMWGS